MFTALCNLISVCVKHTLGMQRDHNVAPIRAIQRCLWKHLASPDPVAQQLVLALWCRLVDLSADSFAAHVVETSCAMLKFNLSSRENCAFLVKRSQFSQILLLSALFPSLPQIQQMQLLSQVCLLKTMTHDDENSLKLPWAVRCKLASSLSFTHILRSLSPDMTRHFFTGLSSRVLSPALAMLKQIEMDLGTASRTEGSCMFHGLLLASTPEFSLRPTIFCSLQV